MGGQPKGVFVGGGIALVALLVFFLTPQAFLFDVVGTVYPAYATLMVLAQAEKADLEFWTTYWLLFSTIRVLSPFMDVVLLLLPFGSYLKLAFLVFLYNPVTRGTDMVLDKVLRPKVFPLLANPK